MRRSRNVYSVLSWPSTIARAGSARKLSNTATKVSLPLRQLATIDAPATAAAVARVIEIASGARSRTRRTFWTTLKPLEQGAVARLYELTVELNWEVFFITQRPATAGATVQLQTQRWLIEHGFPTPSVIPLSGARGKCAATLHLDYLIDDMPQNCVDVLSESSTRSILLVDADDPIADTSARRLGIGTARSVHEVLDLLVQATDARANPSLFEKLRKLVGWK